MKKKITAYRRPKVTEKKIKLSYFLTPNFNGIFGDSLFAMCIGYRGGCVN